MCKYCDSESCRCEYFTNLVGDWYHSVETDEWDSAVNDYVRVKEYGPKYCQYCGNELGGLVKSINISNQPLDML